MIVPVILAGGSGTRLWPVSRELYPKQMINLTNENTMLQNTLKRLEGIEKLTSPVIVCNNEHRFMAAEQLRLINIIPDSIILEPVGRNTAPAIAVAAVKLFEKNPECVMLVLPADHIIENIKNFHDVLYNGYQHAKKGSLITFGIIPDSPQTGYGYIKKGHQVDKEKKIFKIDKFVEKPDLKTAEKYLKSEDYCWNSGMFMFKAEAIIEELKKAAPKMLQCCENAVKKGINDLDFFRVDEKEFEQVESDSIDYAVMEKTSKGVMIPFDAGWNDLGSWDALWQAGKKDDKLNVKKGDVYLHDVTESYLYSENRIVAAVGLEKFVVVDTKDAVLVSPRDRVQDVKKIVEKLKADQRNEFKYHQKVYRPWGSYETIDIEDRFQVKRITVKPGAKLSLQKHFHRAEHWTIVSGSAIATKGENEILLKEDESTYIPVGVVHRLENPGKIPLELIEVQSGSYLGEDDIVRFDDVYGRKEE